MGVPLLPNPYTSLAWLPANIASQVEAGRYICCVVIGAWMWEALTSIPEEIGLLRRYRITLSDIVYLSSRISIMAFLISTLVYQVIPVDDCQALGKVIGWLSAAALPLNSLLFFFRVRAVFSNSRPTIIFFAFMWVAVLAGSLSQPFGIESSHIGTTRNCITTAIQSYCSSGIIIATVNDTLSFIAISIQLLMYTLADTWSARFRAFFSGRGMTHMTRLLMQTGQQYYLTTVGVNIMAMVIILTPSVPPVYRAIIAIPNAAVFNVMACKVYRMVKLGAIKDQTFSSVTSSHNAPIQFAPIPPRSGSAKRGVVNPDDTLNLSTMRMTHATSDVSQMTTDVLGLDIDVESSTGSRGNLATDIKDHNIV